MAYKIKIIGEIGWNATLDSVSAQMAEADGEDLDIDLDTPGGDVFEGISIYNAIRDYKKAHPKSQIAGSMKGLVASMGTYIASNPAFDLMAIEDNAVYMIHNPWTVAMGDQHEMAETADFLSSLSNIMAKVYMAKTGKSEKEIHSMMDKETWLYGEEIINAGFADELTKSSQAKTKADALSESKITFATMKKNVQAKADSKKIAACAKSFLASNKVSSPVDGEQEEEELIKTLDDLKAEAPSVYEAAAKEVKASAIEAERARVKEIKAMDAKYGAVGAIKELCDSAIADGRSASEIALAVADMAISAKESVGDLNTNGNEKETETNEVNASIGFN